MFSMAVAGLAKSLIAVTITLNPAAAHHGPGSYTIRPGGTLSQIAARAYGRAADWPAVWWANRRQVPGPDPRRPAAGPAELTPGAAVACPRRPGRHRFGTACPGGAAAATAAPAGPAPA